MMISKVLLIALASVSSVYCGVLPSAGYVVQQNPIYHQQPFHSFQSPFVAHYPAPAFVQVQRPQHVATINPAFFQVQRPQQIASVSRPQFVAIHAERPQTVIARPVPVQSNVVAIHAERPTARKLVLPYPAGEQPKSYAYEYAVKDQITGDEKSHTETRVGDNVVGRYTIVEPDGTLRVVNYTAGKDGFNAVVEKTPNYAPPNAPQTVQAISKPVVGVSNGFGAIAAAVAVPANNFHYPSGFHFGG